MGNKIDNDKVEQIDIYEKEEANCILERFVTATIYADCKGVSWIESLNLRLSHMILCIQFIVNTMQIYPE